MLRAPLLAALLLAVALAGCANDASTDTGNPDIRPVEATATTGGIRGIVVDERIVPIPDVTIRLLNEEATATTDAAGVFTFSGLAAGTYFLRAEHPLYDSVQQSTDVVAGVSDPSPLRIQLTRLIASDPYFMTMKFQGFIVCSIGGSVFASEECGEGVGVPGVGRVGGQENNQVQQDFTVHGEGAKSMIIEQVWDSSTGVGETSNLYTILATEWSCDPVCGGNRFNETNGASPLYMRLDGEALGQAMAEHGPATVFSTFTWADWGAGGSDPAQLNVVLQQDFELFVTISYHLPMPVGWSFVNGDPDPF